jgi:hypothetical protein
MPICRKLDQEEECVPQVIEMLGARRFIRIDGHSAAGKTRIAKALEKELGWKRFSTDDWLDVHPGDKRSYTDKVRSDALHAALREIPGQGTILEGICINEIVPPEAFGSELKIYVRSYSPPELEADERRRNRKLGTERYHLQFEPERWADLVIMKIAYP